MCNMSVKVSTAVEFGVTPTCTAGMLEVTRQSRDQTRASQPDFASGIMSGTSACGRVSQRGPPGKIRTSPDSLNDFLNLDMVHLGVSSCALVSSRAERHVPPLSHSPFILQRVSRFPLPCSCPSCMGSSTVPSQRGNWEASASHLHSVWLLVKRGMFQWGNNSPFKCAKLTLWGGDVMRVL